MDRLRIRVIYICRNQSDQDRRDVEFRDNRDESMNVRAADVERKQIQFKLQVGAAGGESVRRARNRVGTASKTGEVGNAVQANTKTEVRQLQIREQRAKIFREREELERLDFVVGLGVGLFGL